MTDEPQTFKGRRVGQIMAAYIAAVRAKYGRYPIPDGAEPLAGHEDDVIPKIPDYKNMDGLEFAKLAINRADERRRFRRNSPREFRLMTYTRERRKNAGR